MPDGEGVWRSGRFRSVAEMVDKFNKLESMGYRVTADWEMTSSECVIAAYRLEGSGKDESEGDKKKSVIKKVKEKLRGKGA